MKKNTGEKILFTSLFVISLIALFIFSFTIFIWLDVMVFGLQEPEFTPENNAIFFNYFFKFVLLLGGIGLILTTLYLLRILIIKKVNKKALIIPLSILLEIALIVLEIGTVIYELNTKLIATYSFTVPTFYITHFELVIIAAIGTIFFVTSLRVFINKKPLS